MLSLQGGVMHIVTVGHLVQASDNACIYPIILELFLQSWWPIILKIMPAK